MARFSYPEDFEGTFWTIIDGDYYVSTFGSDINGNGSPKSPFLTVGKAFELTLDGEKVVVGPDEYVEDVAGTIESDVFGSEPPCRLATDSNVDITAGGLVAVDGVTAQAGDRILLFGQTDATENGIYITSANAWVRAENYGSAEDILPGKLIPVLEGTAHGRSVFQNTNTGTITLESSALTFEKLTTGSGGVSITASNGLTLDGSEVKLGGLLNEELNIQGQSNNINITGYGIANIQGVGTVLGATGIGAVLMGSDLITLSDVRTTVRKGFEYADDYASGYTDRSLVDKEYSDGHMGGQPLATNVGTPTASEDGHVLAWNNANQQYELIPAPSGGGFTLTDGNGTTVNGTAVDLNSAGISVGSLIPIKNQGSLFGIDSNDINLQTVIPPTPAIVEATNVRSLEIETRTGSLGSRTAIFLNEIYSRLSTFSSSGGSFQSLVGTRSAAAEMQVSQTGIVNSIEVEYDKLVVRDDFGSKGLVYHADYSSNYTARSLVDKAYVDSVATGGGGITNSAVVNELTKSDGSNLVGSGIFSSPGEVSLGSSNDGLMQRVIKGVGPAVGDFNLTIDSTNQASNDEDNSINLVFSGKLRLGSSDYDQVPTIESVSGANDRGFRFRSGGAGRFVVSNIAPDATPTLQLGEDGTFDNNSYSNVRLWTEGQNSDVNLDIRSKGEDGYVLLGSSVKGHALVIKATGQTTQARGVLTVNSNAKLTISGGEANSGNATGGDIEIVAPDSKGSGNNDGGGIILDTGLGDGTGVSGNIGIFTKDFAQSRYGNGQKVIFISDCESLPASNPLGGGILYVDGTQNSKPFWRSPNGSVYDLTGDTIDIQGTSNQPLKRVTTSTVSSEFEESITFSSGTDTIAQAFDIDSTSLAPNSTVFSIVAYFAFVEGASGNSGWAGESKVQFIKNSSGAISQIGSDSTIQSENISGSPSITWGVSGGKVRATLNTGGSVGGRMTMNFRVTTASIN